MGAYWINVLLEMFWLTLKATVCRLCAFPGAPVLFKLTDFLMESGFWGLYERTARLGACGLVAFFR